MGYYLSDTELYYFNEGNSAVAYQSLGAHPVQRDGKTLWRFSVWAPNARAVSVIGTFNEWNSYVHPMHPVGSTGVWQAHVDTAKRGDLYKYAIVQPDGGMAYKADPYAVYSELRPGTASVVWGIPQREWEDAEYYAGLSQHPDPFTRPMSIYEVHPGSWKAGLTYRELAQQLVEYAADMGYTHIELLPVLEHPLDMSWGYQVTGYFSVTPRYGSPEDFQYFVDCAHQKGLGVLLDWVPAHFPRDAQGLRMFDGTPIYEHPDPRRGEQPQWGTMLFDFGRTQVQSFLLSSAFYWLKEFHIDGLRVDAVSCMLYLDYGKEDGQWCANQYGGRENLDAISFLRKLSHRVGSELPHRLLIAEESTAFPLVTAPPEDGGLGFHFKWNMGWMNDMLTYMSMDPVYRKWHHDKLTFSLYYAFSENFILPFSHDEVVHGKHSMLDKMPGDYWRKFAQARLTYAYQYAHPGKKLNFMGNEFGQFIEWRYDQGLDWLLLDYPAHRGLKDFVQALNRFYQTHPALYACDKSWEGFSWTAVDDNVHSIAGFLRKGEEETLLCAFNFTPVPWENYRMGLPAPSRLTELLSSDDVAYGGTGEWHNAGLMSQPGEVNGQPQFVSLRLPPLGAAFFLVEDAELAPQIKAM